jgi:AraC-like DNA-binding protein/heme exporter protein D
MSWIPGWVAFAVALVLIAVVAKVWADNVKRRRQIDALMIRMQELEAKLAVADGEPTDEIFAEDGVPSASGIYSADVLAGQSSYVARLVSQAERPADLAGQALVAVYRRIEDPIRPSDLADELCVSLRTLQRGLARCLDCTPNQLILTAKMREARRLIASGQLRVGEVAHRLAFADASHLARNYRKFYRCPPSQHLSDTTLPAAPN